MRFCTFCKRNQGNQDSSGKVVTQKVKPRHKNPIWKTVTHDKEYNIPSPPKKTKQNKTKQNKKKHIQSNKSKRAPRTPLKTGSID